MNVKRNELSDRFLGFVGFAALATGILYIVVQIIHPADVLASVTTFRWGLTHVLSLVMDVLAFVTVVGLYAICDQKTGLLGRLGYVLFGIFWIISFAFHFIEAFILPSLVGMAPHFVEGLQGLVTNHPSTVDLGAVSAIYTLTGIMYLLGGTLLGMSLFRNSVLPKWAGGLLLVGALVTITRAFIPHPIDRLMAIPMGAALLWIGWCILKMRSIKPADRYS